MKIYIKIKKAKNGPYIIYGDLFYYADGKQDNIRKTINNYINKDTERNKKNDEKKEENQNNLNKKIKEIIDIYIKFYEPKMIVITNAYASDLIKEALKSNSKIIDEECNIKNNKEKEEDYDAIEYKNDKNEEIPIIFSGMVSGGHALDKYSYIRIQNRIKKIYNKYNGGK